MADMRQYTIEEFHQQFCRLTGLADKWSRERIRRACRGDVVPRSDELNALPKGWECFQLDNRQWRICSTKDHQDNFGRQFMRELVCSKEPSLDQLLKLYPQKALLEKRDYLVLLKFGCDGSFDAELVKPKEETRLGEPGYLFYMAWALMLLSNKRLRDRANVIAHFQAMDLGRPDFGGDAEGEGKQGHISEPVAFQSGKEVVR